MEYALVYPHQLFDPHPALAPGRRTLLLEDPLFFGNDLHWPLRFHVQKLILHRATMSHWLEQQCSVGHYVKRIECPVKPTTSDAMLAKALPASVKALHVCDPVDDVLERRLRRFAEERSIRLVIHESPMFLSPLTWLREQLGGRKKPFMAHFYQAQRKRLGILLDEKGGPLGGQWSFDTENRLRLPKGHRAPSPPVFPETEVLSEARTYIAEKFPEARGSAASFRWPVTRAQALQELHTFLHDRLALFGHYEDAISHGQPWLYHSLLTAPLNIGLITPHEVVEQTLEHASHHDIPLNSLEGFIRQIIGWREFMRGIYALHGVRIRRGNHWNHHEPLPPLF